MRHVRKTEYRYNILTTTQGKRVVIGQRETIPEAKLFIALLEDENPAKWYGRSKVSIKHDQVRSEARMRDFVKWIDKHGYKCVSDVLGISPRDQAAWIFDALNSCLRWALLPDAPEIVKQWARHCQAKELQTKFETAGSMAEKADYLAEIQRIQDAEVARILRSRDQRQPAY